MMVKCHWNCHATQIWSAVLPDIFTDIPLQHLKCYKNSAEPSWNLWECLPVINCAVDIQVLGMYKSTFSL